MPYLSWLQALTSLGQWRQWRNDRYSLQRRSGNGLDSLSVFITDSWTGRQGYCIKLNKGAYVLMLLASFLNGLPNVLQTILLLQGLGAKVGMAACTIPVPRNGPVSKGCYHPKVFTYMMQNEMGHPEMIFHVDSFTRSCLEFPLGRHDFSIYSVILTPASKQAQ